jgi:hypothetical protein
MSAAGQFGKLAADYVHNQMRCKGALKGSAALNIHNTLAEFAVFSLVACDSGTPQQPPLATEGVTDAMLAGGNGDE